MALTGMNNEQKIWNYLKAAGLNDCGAAGMMGNLYAESGLHQIIRKTPAGLNICRLYSGNG